MEVFDCINSERLSNLISSAQDRILLVAPSVSKQVADALVVASQRISSLRIVIDPGEWVYRLGYGEIEGLAALEAANLTIHRCSGLRIGVIETDQEFYVFSPTPLQIEREPTHPQTPNAVRIAPAEANRIMDAVAPSADLTEKKAEIGNIRITKEEITETKKAIEERPPVKPDLNRQMSVLNSEFQFVETTFKGGSIERRTLHLSAKDLGIKRRRLSARIAGTYKIIEEGKVKQFDDINQKLQKIRKKYLKSVDRYGSVIDYRDKFNFKAAIEVLIEELNAAKEVARAELALRLAKSREELKPLIVRNFKQLSKDELAELLYPDEFTPENLEKFVSSYLDERFPKADDLIDEMECSYEFRMIAPEHLSDDRFRKNIERALGRPLSDLASREAAVATRKPPRQAE